MRRLLAVAAAVVMLGLGGLVARADGLPTDATSLGRPNLGCHRVYFTPPGWGGPIEIDVCP